eukprot:621945-Prymnesium_polylepis.1
MKPLRDTNRASTRRVLASTTTWCVQVGESGHFEYRYWLEIFDVSRTGSDYASAFVYDPISCGDKDVYGYNQVSDSVRPGDKDVYDPAACGDKVELNKEEAVSVVVGNVLTAAEAAFDVSGAWEINVALTAEPLITI